MKIGMISLGCPKNLVDSEVMLGLAQQAGHQLTRDAEDADVLIVNTCAFIDKARQRLAGLKSPAGATPTPSATPARKP